MSTTPHSAGPFASPIYNRIGPIVDRAYLGLLNEEQLHQITLTSVRAELSAAREYTKALEDVLKTVESVKFQGGKAVKS